MTSLTLDQAQTLLRSALARARESGFKPMGIAVLDAAGNLKAYALSLIHI